MRCELYLKLNALSQSPVTVIHSNPINLNYYRHGNAEHNAIGPANFDLREVVLSISSNM